MTKSELEQQNTDLQAKLTLHEIYLEHAFRGEVTAISKGSVRLCICGETRPNGGVILESIGTEGCRRVVGIYPAEAYLDMILKCPDFPFEEVAQDRQTLARNAAVHIAKAQSVANALTCQSA